MLLFYTGATQSGVQQKLAEKSLGGYISSTIIPNGQVNNLFSTLSLSDVQTNSSIVRVIALKNLTSNPITGITIYPVLPDDSMITLQLAISSPFIDGCGNENYELLSSETSLPYYANFQTYDSNSPFVYSSSLPVNSSIGIFIMRGVNQDNVPNFTPITTDQTGIENLAEVITDYQNSDKLKQFSLVISW